MNVAAMESRIKKVYISGKIGELPSQVFEEKFKQAAQELVKKGFDPVNPVTIVHDHDKTWESFMKADLKAMLDCDAVFMLSCWKESRGAKIERSLALHLGIELIYQEGEVSK